MKTIHEQFAARTKEILQQDDTVIGVAISGSWLTHEIDEFSDLDLIIVTTGKISGSVARMQELAGRIGHLLASFTGEHVGEPRLLICLYDDPLLHVDLKFLTLEEFHHRVEEPVILLDKNGQLQQVLQQSTAAYPMPGYQWMEDRFWIWIHYALLKIGRGEYFEALDFFGFMRMAVLGPLLQIRNGQLPRGVRKVETGIAAADLAALKSTLATYDVHSLLAALENTISLYTTLRTGLFGADIRLQPAAEKRVTDYLAEIKERMKIPA